ncbi:hypothetical protein G7Y89_g10771 [Cudoniella acicularis]|uniref:Uncharacterized protein n=1 Tax=Cudoniella acicularis TaxID=354080 RepID=A0A8H4REU2_9HELO|nr:hypothetical protein G7Y89_g10771 [Cudoniella acicularis]
MASVSFYDYSIGYYTKALNVLLRILKMASSHPDIESFLEARLAPDMLPLLMQIRIATVPPMTLVRALTSNEPVTWDQMRMATGEQEKAWPELIEHVEKTPGILEEVNPNEVETKSDDTKLPLYAKPDSDVPVDDFTMANGIPTVFLHVYMAYAILRFKGVDVGKKDILIPSLPGYILDEFTPKQAV